MTMYVYSNIDVRGVFSISCASNDTTTFDPDHESMSNRIRDRF